MQKTTHSERYRALILWLRAGRIQRSLNMRQVAARLKVPHTWVGKIEQCERRLDVQEFYDLCVALDMDPHAALDLLNPTAYSLHRRKSPPLAAESPDSPVSPPSEHP